MQPGNVNIIFTPFLFAQDNSMKSVLLASTFLLSAVVGGVSQSIPASYSDPQYGWYKEVTTLPGWDATTPLPARLLSGYVNLSGVPAAMSPAMTPSNVQPTEMYMHYYFYQVESGDPLTKPTVVWWNGGPGASSAWGLFVEVGPLLLNKESVVHPAAAADRKSRFRTIDQSNKQEMLDLYRQLKAEFEGGVASPPLPASDSAVVSDDDIRLIENPYAWTKFASILSFANPPPIGFSYCMPQGPSGKPDACGTWNDTRVGIVNAESLRIVFDYHLPMLLRNPAQSLHFTGESYAGVFIGETLAYMLADVGRFQTPLGALAGVALGDACLGSDVLCGGASGPYTSLLFMYGHGQASTEMWEELLKNCPGDELKQRTQTATCSAAVNAFEAQLGNYYEYNLYDQCENDPFQATLRASGVATKKMPPSHHSRRSNMRPSSLQAQTVGATAPKVPSFNGYWCDGMVWFDYFKKASVRNAVFVPLNSSFYNADDGRGMPYVYNTRTIFPTVTALLGNKDSRINKGRSVKFMAYVGDADPSVNVFAVEDAWMRVFVQSAAYGKTLPLTRTIAWNNWLLGFNNTTTQGAGYIAGWSAGATDAQFPDLAVSTIRGSGHMVPEYKPLAAYVLFDSFFNNKNLPYAKTTTARP